MVNSVTSLTVPIDYVFLIGLTLFIVQLTGCFGGDTGELKKIADASVTVNTMGDESEMDGKELSKMHKDPNQVGGMMQRLLPLLVIPFLISSAIIPGMLISIKILLVKGLFTGVIAGVIMILNIFRGRINGGGVFNHYTSDLNQEHYGYQGYEEPGAYINRRRRRLVMQ
ncbi:uncharacterized protein Osi22 [Euwallacea fornicatus]|uniref:uncharacterized protein Osi22 n=1 Tax=Euwallacea fornicatus TaxID=995702 RepID=UPI00338E1FB0